MLSGLYAGVISDRSSFHRTILLELATSFGSDSLQDFGVATPMSAMSYKSTVSFRFFSVVMPYRIGLTYASDSLGSIKWHRAWNATSFGSV